MKNFSVSCTVPNKPEGKLMRKLILAAICLSALVGCSTPEGRARMREANEANEAAQYALVSKVQALPASAKLECQLQGQQASAAASNPRALFDIVAGAYGVQAQDTCLLMHVARADEQRAATTPAVVRSAQVRKTAYVARGPNEPAPLSDGRPWYCGMPDTANTRIMVECQ